MIIIVLLLLGTLFLAGMVLYAHHKLDHAVMAEEYEAQIREEERRIREVTDKILAERRSKQDAENRLDSGTF